MATEYVKGGDKLEAALNALAKKVSTPATLRVGFLENSNEPDGTSSALVAAINEFGAPRAGIPPRPFFRTMVAAKSPEWPAAIGDLLVDNNYDVEKTLEITGVQVAGQLKDSISAVMSPPLSPVTLMLRKMRSQDQTLVVNRTVVEEARRRVAAGESYAGVSTKPLIDSGTLQQNVGYEVKS
jgi:hypothetical protein